MPDSTSSPLITGFHHAAAKVADFDGFVAFLRDGLGLVENIGWGEGDQRAVLLRTPDGAHVEVFAGGMPDDPAEARLRHLALRTGDCDAAFRRALACGAVARMEPKDVTIRGHARDGRIRIAFVTAPGGVILEFFQSDEV